MLTFNFESSCRREGDHSPIWFSVRALVLSAVHVLLAFTQERLRKLVDHARPTALSWHILTCIASCQQPLPMIPQAEAVGQVRQHTVRTILSDGVSLRIDAAASGVGGCHSCHGLRRAVPLVHLNIHIGVRIASVLQSR